jgi:hypothetical protein
VSSVGVALTLRICIRKAFCSNLGRVITYFHVCRSFLQSLGECLGGTLKYAAVTTHDHHMYLHFIGHYPTYAVE